LLSQVQPGLLDPLLRPLTKRIAGLLDLQHPGSDRLTARIQFLQAAGRQGAEYFPTVAGALAQRRQLRLRYFNRGDDSRSERAVSPQRLTYYRDNWYLDAWCHLRQGLRTFALDAIEEARALDDRALDVPETELEAHYANSYGIFAGVPSRVAVLRFSARRARWVAKERWHRDQEGRALPDGRYELRVPYSNTPELLMDILKYGPDLEVIAPEELRAEVIARLTSALASYPEAGRSP
jgi:predicted DNA-binding transcriptional regulator YafY